jgi:hypothetical protein
MTTVFSPTLLPLALSQSAVTLLGEPSSFTAFVTNSLFVALLVLG